MGVTSENENKPYDQVFVDMVGDDVDLGVGFAYYVDRKNGEA